MDTGIASNVDELFPYGVVSLKYSRRSCCNFHMGILEEIPERRKTNLKDKNLPCRKEQLCPY